MYFIIPIISACIGWFTNWVAVKMLFHPKKPIKFLFIKFQGVVPKRQQEIATGLGEVVQDHLIDHDKVVETLFNSVNDDELRVIIEDKIELFLSHKLAEFNPMFAMFITGELKQQIKGILYEEIKAVVPDLIEKFSHDIENKLDFKEIVFDKVKHFDTDTLEKVMFGLARNELKHIEIYGAVLGFVIGLFQVAVLYFIK